MTISEEKLYWILVDVAAYMHEKEQSGSMDRLLLSRICHFSLEAWYRKNDGALLSSRIKLQEETEEFIQMIDQDEGLLVVRGEQMFRFAQTTFQEYFTCQRLVYNSSNKQDVKQTLEMLVAYIRNPRYRLPLLLSFGFLSSRWSKTNFNLLCEQLIDLCCLWKPWEILPSCQMSAFFWRLSITLPGFTLGMTGFPIILPLVSSFVLDSKHFQQSLLADGFNYIFRKRHHMK
jgi:hypothetical protein